MFNYGDLKSKFLNLDEFIDNEYLDSYINLIITSGSDTAIKHKTQKHHILPRAWYNHYKLSVDNSENNVTNLLYKDHILAHYYLIKCTNSWLKWSNQSAFFQMIGRKNIDGLEELLENLSDLQSEYEEFCLQDSINNYGEKNGNYGHYWSDEKKLNLSRKLRDLYANNEDLKLSISKRMTEYYKTHNIHNKGKKGFYNKDGKLIYANECPEGCTTVTPEEISERYRLLAIGNKSTAGYKWYTNGIDSKVCLPENKPNGWWEGRTYTNMPGKLGAKAYHDVNGSIYYLYDYELFEGLIKGTGVHTNNSGELNPMFGKKHSKETKVKMRNAKVGKYNGDKNPAYGRKWYTDGNVRIYIKGEPPEGFYNGYKRWMKTIKEEDINKYLRGKLE